MINSNDTIDTEQKSICDGDCANCKYLDGAMFADMVRGGAALLRLNADTVNQLNVFPVPDGDTGDNMRMTLEGGVAALTNLHTDNLSDVTKSLSQGMLLGARGNSGVILSQFFAGMTKGFTGHQRADVNVVGKALEEGVKQAYASVITPTEGTILTVAREAVAYAVGRIHEGSTIRDVFNDVAIEMNNSLQRTPELLPVLKEAGVIDSGGAGLCYILQGFHKALCGEEIENADTLSTVVGKIAVGTAAPDLSLFGADSEMTYGYCTELLIQLQNRKTDIEAFDPEIIIEYLKKIGDSIVCFKTDSKIKLHVHTMTPEAVLGFCRQFGEFLTVKIENMNVQHHESSENRKVSAQSVSQQKDFGCVAVASGAGMEQLFRELGVDEIVQGGQTQNPSAQDFLSAFAKVDAKHIFVFPNNGNIIMAAKQAAQLYKDGAVHVVESRDIGQGYSAISSMNFQSGDPDEIMETFNEAMEAVKTGFITTSVRDTILNGIQISCGDWIGFVGKEMLVSEKDQLSAAKKLLDRMMEQEVYLVTAFIGSDADEKTVEALSAYAAETYPDIEFYTVEGGQEVYPFILAAE